jgi:protein-S-isoprenylcysteine O-methyltransferase Ste14
MFVFVRAVTYATAFTAFVLIAMPARVLDAAGVQPPAAIGAMQIVGALAGSAGALLAVACILTFVVAGKGTQAPFDPPRRLVVSGPYHWVRNPMYLGGALAISGAALYYQSLALAAYAGLFLLATHLFVVAYEEPTLRRLFDGAYDEYCRHVRRWLVHV